MDKVDKIIEVKLQELWPWKKREKISWKVSEPTPHPKSGWGKNIITEIPSQKCVVAFYKVPKSFYLALVICVPHNVNDPYDYEAGETSNIFTDKLYWRRFPTGGGSNKKYMEFQSEDGLSENGPWYFDSFSKVMKHCRSLESENMIIEDFICTTTITVNFNDDPDTDYRALRAMRYELAGIKSNLVGSKLVFEAKDLVHDYTSFAVDRGYFLDPKLKVLGIEKLKEQFANPNPFPHTPSDPTWNTGAYAPSIPIKDRRDIDDEEEEEEELEEKTSVKVSSRSARQLPKDLFIFLTRKDGGESPKDIDRWHKEAIKWLEEAIENHKGDIDEQWSIESLELVRTHDLFMIYQYGNGDLAWFSFVDKKVYDYNHDLEAFNIVVERLTGDGLSSSYGGEGTKPVDYKEWIVEIKTGKRSDAWERD